MLTSPRKIQVRNRVWPGFFWGSVFHSMADGIFQGNVSGSFALATEKRFYAAPFSVSKGHTNNMTQTIVSWNFTATNVLVIWTWLYSYGQNGGITNATTVFRPQGSIDFGRPGLSLNVSDNGRTCIFDINATNIGISGTNTTAGSRYANWQFDGSVIAIGNK